jgi:uncharacterized membrane protein
MQQIFIKAVLIAACVTAVASNGKAAPSYTFTNIDYPGAVRTAALGINDSGQIVGYYYADLSGPFHGFLRSGGTYTSIDYPGAAQTYAYGINANGQIVGVYFDVVNCGNCRGVEHPFLLSNGIYTALPEAPGSMPHTTQALGINSGGQIVGLYVDPCFCRIHGFLLSGGVFTIIDDPGFFSSGAQGINDSGQIVGYGQQVWGGGSAHGYLLSSGVFTTLDDPQVPQPESGVTGTIPNGIGKLGDVVGYYGATSGQLDGFLLSGGVYTTVDAPNSQPGSNAAWGVNSSKQIVGSFTDSSGAIHGFLATSGPLYNVCLLYDPTKAVKSGATIPIKLQLCDAGGNDQSSATITLHATGVTQTSTSISGDVEDAGNANPDDNFRFDSTLGPTGGYIFNLKTTGLSTGSYSINFTVTGDTAAYAAPFQVK